MTVRRRGGLLIGCLAALMSATPAHANVRLTAEPSTVAAGGTVNVTIAGTRTTCTLTLRSAKRGAKLIARRQIARNGQTRRAIVLAISPQSRPGMRVLGAKCGRTALKVRLRVTPNPHIAMGAVPFDTAAADALHVEGNVGGGPFSTRAPFAKGTAHQVTQAPGGGVSHDNQYNRNAVDLAAPVGTELLAGFTGVIAAAQGGCTQGNTKCNGGYGNLVLLKHSDGTCALFGHLDTIAVNAGQQVPRNTKVGTVGLTGNTTGPHLHYDRIDCGTRVSLPWGFEENAQPKVGQNLVSSNEPEAPAETPKPPVDPPPARTLTVDNRVTNGAAVREDPAGPATLSTKPWVRCRSRGCEIAGTGRATGQTFENAVCTTQGERTTNGNDSDPADDQNPERRESTLYYAIRLEDGSLGYLNEVWVRKEDRGGLGLPGC